MLLRGLAQQQFFRIAVDRRQADVGLDGAGRAGAPLGEDAPAAERGDLAALIAAVARFAPPIPIPSLN